MKQVGESEDSESEADELWLVEEVGGIHKLYQQPIKVPVCVDGVNVYGARHWRLGINSIRSPIQAVVAREEPRLISNQITNLL